MMNLYGNKVWSYDIYNAIEVLDMECYEFYNIESKQELTIDEVFNIIMDEDSVYINGYETEMEKVDKKFFECLALSILEEECEFDEDNEDYEDNCGWSGDEKDIPLECLGLWDRDNEDERWIMDTMFDRW